MGLTYVRIELYTSEEAHVHGVPVYDAIAKAVRDAKVAARCVVTKGIAGCYENGELVSHRILDLAVNLPVKVEIVAPAAEEDLLLRLVAPLVGEGILLVSRPELRMHRTARPLLPRNLRVRDLMTPQPVSVGPDSPATDVARLLISREFNAVPVVGGDGKVLGIVSEGDLVERAGLPLRAGLLGLLDEPVRDRALGGMAAFTAAQVMTASPVTALEGEPLRAAVDRMLDRGLKRLPVVDEAGRLVGMLSRVDIFRGVTGHGPDPVWFAQRGVEVTPALRVGDLPLQESATVPPRPPWWTSWSGSTTTAGGSRWSIPRIGWWAWSAIETSSRSSEKKVTGRCGCSAASAAGRPRRRPASASPPRGRRTSWSAGW